MDIKEMISKAEAIVKDAGVKFSNEYVGGIDCWTGHVCLVVKYACMFANLRGADEDVTRLASILHDYARYKDVEKYGKQHAEAGAELAKELLEGWGLEQSKVNNIYHSIYNHDKPNQKEINTLEGICLADADAYVHIVNCFEIYNAFNYLKKPKNTFDSLVGLLNKVEFSYSKMSDYGKEYARNDYNTITNYIKKALTSYE